MNVPYRPWAKRFQAIESRDDALILLDQIEEMDTTNQFEHRLKRCREYATRSDTISSIRNALANYLTDASSLDEENAKSNYGMNPQ
jgi:ribosomal protein S17E